MDPATECLYLLPEMSHLSAISYTLTLCFVLSPWCAESQDVLCKAGNTSFEAYFHTGIELRMGPEKDTGLATRFCQATLSAKTDVTIATDAAEIDLDMFGVDLGDNGPVAGFQVKKSSSQCCMIYQIYSLGDPPHLVRTIKGGSYFSAIDTNLDGRVEIWTDDALTFEGFEGLRVNEIEFLPTYVLRLEKGRLLNVTAEFQDFFDQTIAEIRANINPDDLRKLKAVRSVPNTKGTQPSELTVAPQLRKVKIQIIEIVWAYLYSGREKIAWRTLEDSWPMADVERVRSEILARRSKGMRAQFDGESNVPVPDKENEIITIYDSTDKPAKPIMVRYYPESGSRLLKGKVRVDLVVDSAGKVHSVKVSGKKEGSDSLKRSTKAWKFIPALVDGHSVASRVRMTLALAQ
jgi:hypothetical protein